MSSVQRGKIIAFIEQEMSQRPIGVSQSVVSRANVGYQELETTNNKPRRSRQRVTTDRRDRSIVQIDTRNENGLHTGIQRQFLKVTGVSVSVKTIPKKLQK